VSRNTDSSTGGCNSPSFSELSGCAQADCGTDTNADLADFAALQQVLGAKP
jgi:hypothetical protein